MGARVTKPYIYTPLVRILSLGFPDVFPYFRYDPPAIPVHLRLVNETPYAANVRLRFHEYRASGSVRCPGATVLDRNILMEPMDCSPISTLLIVSWHLEHSYREWIGGWGEVEVWTAPAFASPRITSLSPPRLSGIDTKFSVPFVIRNEGVDGRVRGRLAEGILFEQSIKEGETLRGSFDMTMGCQPLSEVFSLENLEECDNWNLVEYRNFLVELGAPDLRIEGISAPGSVAAGENYGIAFGLVNRGEIGDVRLMLGEEEISSMTLEGGQRVERTFTFSMPYDDVVHHFRAESRAKCRAWAETDSKVVEIPALFPKLEISRIEAPATVAAGESFHEAVFVKNTGAAGNVRFLEDGNVVFAERIAEGVPLDLSRDLDMPYDDVSHSFSAQSLQRHRVWTETSAGVLSIKAGFPSPVIDSVTRTESAPPGQSVSISPLVLNEGYRGDIGIRCRDLVRGERIESDWFKSDRGKEIGLRFDSTMPPTEAVGFTVMPLHIGRYRETIAGDETKFKIDAVDAVFIHEDEIACLGDSEKEYYVAGVIIAEELALGISAITEQVKFTRYEEKPISALPPAPPIALGTVFAFPVPVKEKIIPFAYSRLIYLRYKIDIPLSVVQFGRIVATDVKEWEYSVFPTPFMLPRQISQMLKPKPRTEITLP